MTRKAERAKRRSEWREWWMCVAFAIALTVVAVGVLSSTRNGILMPEPMKLVAMFLLGAAFVTVLKDTMPR